jgi:hypothetical protein
VFLHLQHLVNKSDVQVKLAVANGYVERSRVNNRPLLNERFHGFTAHRIHATSASVCRAWRQAFNASRYSLDASNVRKISGKARITVALNADMATGYLRARRIGESVAGSGGLKRPTTEISCRETLLQYLKRTFAQQSFWLRN